MGSRLSMMTRTTVVMKASCAGEPFEIVTPHVR